MTTILQLIPENIGRVVNLNFCPAKVVRLDSRIIAVYALDYQIAIVDKPPVSDWFFDEGRHQYAQVYAALIDQTHPDYERLLPLLPTRIECRLLK